MQQNERIELIKAAAMLSIACYQHQEHISESRLLELLDHFYDYLQLKLEASSGINKE